ncbi:hypothetical protein ACVBEQ_27980 [Nakamurella sp. GG22]
MNDDYEFRVTGLIGPLTRAAMPELESYRCERETILIGTAPDEEHISALLERLDQADVTTSELLITRTVQHKKG